MRALTLSAGVLLGSLLLTPSVWAAEESPQEREFRVRLAEECEKAGNDLAVAVKDNAKKTKRSYQCVKDGKIEGKHTGVYLPGLEKESTGQICDGKFCGHWERWDRSGAIIDAGDWEAGVPQGDWTFYKTGKEMAPGTRKEFGRMVNGKKVCGWTVLDAHGGVDEAASGAYCVSAATPPEVAANVNPTAPSSPLRSNLRFGVGLGYSFIRNTERATDFSMHAMTPKVGARYRLSENFSLGVSAFMTALTLSSSNPEAKVSVLGSNLRLDYRAPFRWGPLVPALAAGLSYGRMFVSGANFGYGNLLYPQIFPSLSWPAVFGSLALYGKYVPMGGSIFSTETRELAWGLSFEPRIQGKSAGWSGSIDYSDLKVRPGDRFLISTQVVTVGIGLLL